MLSLRKLCVFFMVPGIVYAQGSSPSSTASAAAATHSVNVGATGHHFTPDSLKAAKGDIIEFRFYPLNHSVARADFRSPCFPYELTGAGRVGFWSGFEPVNVVTSDPPIFRLLINDTNPLFYYCSAPGACEDGMVGVINPNSTQTLAVQEAYAHNATIAFSPGEGFPPETKSSSAATATATSPPAASSSSSHPALGTGAIAGIAIGGVAVLLLGGALIYLCGRQKTMGEILRRDHRSSLPPPSYVPGPGHMSMASSAAYSKSPYTEGGGAQRYSAQGGALYGGEEGSYRSRSPAVDEVREKRYGSPGLGVVGMGMGGGGGENGTPVSRTGSPLARRLLPSSSGRGPVTLSDGPSYEQQLGDGEELQRNPSRLGPHELGTDNVNDRGYVPYQAEIQSPTLGRN
ncbi:uncharacterized protein L3040_009153 [Drepanopeziza brunnea f. sp. 'multigermtubi']|uniref:uncharacterized protein n=1 Tax=Drepanopeziza brunnea f. sp. 'multigermtubi' TaxID=698441 RepID=UPI00238639B3|nr:hypothetical protein L3040_009153 [Drepanopeziza brunnea f. sp. 'multigermtubi']